MVLQQSWPASLFWPISLFSFFLFQLLCWRLHFRGFPRLHMHGFHWCSMCSWWSLGICGHGSPRVRANWLIGALYIKCSFNKRRLFSVFMFVITCKWWSHVSAVMYQLCLDCVSRSVIDNLYLCNRISSLRSWFFYLQVLVLGFQVARSNFDSLSGILFGAASSSNPVRRGSGSSIYSGSSSSSCQLQIKEEYILYRSGSSSLLPSDSVVDYMVFLRSSSTRSLWFFFLLLLITMS